MTARLALGVLVAALMWPTAAAAATIDIVVPSGLSYTAAAGETNVLDVRLEGTTIVFTETAAALSTSVPFCTPRSPGVVACDPPFQIPVSVDLGDGSDTGVISLPALQTIQAGDGDDTLTLTNLTPDTAPLEGTGGPGNDVVTAASGSVLARGGPGDDHLISGAATTSLFGDEGTDRLTGSPGGETLWGGAGGDMIEAGDGNDTVLADSQFGGDGPDTVDAGAGDDTVWGGGGNDALFGGSGADTVNGQDGADRVYGSEDNDRVDGGAGNDWVVGDSGEDVLLGGAGNDRVIMGWGRDRADAGDGDDQVIATDGVSTKLACGTGEDRVMPGARDRVHLDCETIEQAASCKRRCRVSGVLETKRGVVLGRGSVRLRANRVGSVRVPLSSKGRNAVRRAGKLAVRLIVDTGKPRRVIPFSLQTSL